MSTTTRPDEPLPPQGPRTGYLATAFPESGVRRRPTPRCTCFWVQNEDGTERAYSLCEWHEAHDTAETFRLRNAAIEREAASPAPPHDCVAVEAEIERLTAELDRLR